MTGGKKIYIYMLITVCVYIFSCTGILFKKFLVKYLKIQQIIDFNEFQIVFHIPLTITLIYTLVSDMVGTLQGGGPTGKEESKHISRVSYWLALTKIIPLVRK